MKRTQETYDSFTLYEEVKPLQDKFNLTNDQTLVLAILYNLTSKGKKRMEHRIMPGVWQGRVMQHRKAFSSTLAARGFEKNILPLLNELEALGLVLQFKPIVKRDQWGPRYSYDATTTPLVDEYAGAEARKLKEIDIESNITKPLF